MAVYTTINDPSVYFQTLLYTGGSSSYTNDGNSDLQPDWVWIKARNNAYEHKLFDSSRGTTKLLVSNSTVAEATQSGLTAFNSDGFSLGGDGGSNDASTNFAAWQWKANGGTTASNSDGSITSTVQANTTSGFSVVTYTGNGSSGATIGHGLSTPDVVLIKSRSITGYWIYNSFIIGSTGGTPDAPRNLYLNDTSAGQSDKVCRNISASTFEISSSSAANTSGDTYVAYCFKNVQGYQKTGLYTGNGSTDGAFVYTGFSPAWVLVKRTDSGNNWHMHDNKRVPYNSNDKTLYANLNNAEATEDLDMLSNGFKLRESGGGYNASGGTYIYMAFAENPFVTSDGVPTTAR